MRRVIVHIDQLVLRGFSRQDRWELAGGLEQGLVDALSSTATGAKPGSTGDSAHLDAGRVHLGVDADPGQAGIRIGTSVGGLLRP